MVFDLGYNLLHRRVLGIILVVTFGDTTPFNRRRYSANFSNKNTVNRMRLFLVIAVSFSSSIHFVAELPPCRGTIDMYSFVL